MYQMVYGPTVFFAKLSLFILYLKLFSPDQRTRLLIYLGIITCFSCYMATAISMMALCIPRSGNSWLGAMLSPRCTNVMAMTYVQGVFNIVSDFYILLLPVCHFHDGVFVSMFCFRLSLRASAYWGYRACIASSLGLYYRIVLANDFNWTLHEIPLCSLVYVLDRGNLYGADRLRVIEMTLGIICGCMPYVASTLKQWQPTSSPMYLLKEIKSRITMKLNKRSSESGKSESSHEVFIHPKQDHRLETRILGSIQGGGKFLGSQSPQQREWFNRSTGSQRGYREGTIVEV